MAKKNLNIVQVSTFDISGGAERIAWTLHHAYRYRNHHSWLAVGYKRTQCPDVLHLSREPRLYPWIRIWMKLANSLFPLAGRIKGAGRMYHLCKKIEHTFRQLPDKLGYENFNFPSSYHLPNLPPRKPDIIHCHNLHGGYFDLRVLPWLSRQIPVMFTLHDAWLLSGHCAHSFGCERWKIGCGHCPDLKIPLAIQKDATRYNWRRKHAIYCKSSIYLATPCHWLMEKVEQSMLTPAIINRKVIPYGIDLSIFHPADKQTVRRKLGVPSESKIILFTAIHGHENPYKDYNAIQSAVHILAEHLPDQHILFIALGKAGEEKRIGNTRMIYAPHQKEPAAVARYYQAADVYVHAAKADTFPNTVLEAQACGTPVVATAVCGISEQIADGETGFLTPPGAIKAMVTAVYELLTQPDLCQKFGRQAAHFARQRFDLERMVTDYLGWYQEILKEREDG